MDVDVNEILANENADEDSHLEEVPFDERKMLALVEKYPQLYNPNHKGFNQLMKKSSIWVDIGKQLNANPKLLQKRWHNIRNVFRRSLVSTGKKRRDYYLRDALDFYMPYVKMTGREQQKSINIENPLSSSSNCYEDEIEETIPSWNVMQPLKFTDLNKSTNNHQESRLSSAAPTTTSAVDVDQGFLFSMLPDLETLDPSGKRLFKEKIFTWLRELHDDMDHEKSQQITSENTAHRSFYENSSSSNIMYNNTSHQQDDSITEIEYISMDNEIDINSDRIS